MLIKIAEIYGLSLSDMIVCKLAAIEEKPLTVLTSRLSFTISWLKIGNTNYCSNQLIKMGTHLVEATLRQGKQQSNRYQYITHRPKQELGEFLSKLPHLE